jgi:CPA2 family monovalent cation:H+ antiporter-2
VFAVVAARRAIVQPADGVKLAGGRAAVETMLVQISIYAAAAVVAVPLAQRLGLGSVLGYLAAGVALGPVLGLIGPEAEDVQHYAEFGVVLMLFLIGLELEPRSLWEMRGQLLGLGGVQVGLTLAVLAAAGVAIGLPWNQAVATGMILCLSSTAIVLQTLTEKRLTRTEGGRATVAVLLFQDIAAVPFLALMPLLAFGATPEAEGELQVLEDIPGWAKALLVAGATAAVIGAGRFLTRPLFRFIDWAGLHEIYVAAALLFVAGIALAMSLLGLSPALGSFLAGVVLAGTEYRHELEADIGPFKGLLLGLFFIAVGANVDLALFAARPLPILGLTLGLLALKLAILHGVARLAGIAGGDRMLFTLALAQAGEFGFVLVSFAALTSVLPPERATTILLVISLSMLLTPALFALHDRLARRIGGRARAPDEIDERGAVIVAGMGRFGQTVNRLLAGLGHKTVVLDSRLETVDRVRRLGIKGFYGDVARPELLEAAGIAEARALVIAIDDPEKALRMVRHVSRRYPEVRIVARARDRHHVYALHAAGADETVREVFDGAVRAGEHVLAALGYEDAEIERATAAFFEHDRRMLAELAELWDPDVQPENNAAYLAKEREQYRSIAAAMQAGRGAEVPGPEAAGDAGPFRGRG